MTPQTSSIQTCIVAPSGVPWASIISAILPVVDVGGGTDAVDIAGLQVLQDQLFAAEAHAEPSSRRNPVDARRGGKPIAISQVWPN
jgi:hypothetical protein